jgi:hypothetical protein
MNSVPQLYSIDLGTFQAALLIRYPQRCWNWVMGVGWRCGTLSPRRAPPTPHGNPGCLALQGPVQPYEM